MQDCTFYLSKWIHSIIHRNGIYIQCILPLNQWIGNSFSLTSSLRYSEIYQNKYICDVNLFAGALKMLVRRQHLVLEDGIMSVDLSFPPLPISLLIQRKVNLWK